MVDYGLDLSNVERDIVLPDLVAEGAELDALVSAQDDWSRPTPAAGRTIAHQIAHLAAADATVLIAIRSPEAFDAVLTRAEAAGGSQADLEAAEVTAKPRSVLQDIFDTVGVVRRPTNRLRHVASLGVIGRTLSFYAAGLPVPAEPFRVELIAPDGQTWGWGPDDAEQRVRGSALAFCLRVTQRRLLAETDLTAVGEDARNWLEVARVFR